MIWSSILITIAQEVEESIRNSELYICCINSDLVIHMFHYRGAGHMGVETGLWRCS